MRAHSFCLVVAISNNSMLPTVDIQLGANKELFRDIGHRSTAEELSSILDVVHCDGIILQGKLFQETTK